MKKYLYIIFFPFIIFAYYEAPWGKDSDLSLENKISKKADAKTKGSILIKVADKVISFKQKVISPIDGPRSHFRPTSSRYMQLAMQRYGFFKGYIMGCDRLLRENSEKWVYRTIEIDGISYKYDPALENKFR